MSIESLKSTQGTVITCKAAVAWGPNEGLDITEVQVAPPKEGEVRVKVLSNALCHTDIYTLDGHDPEGLFPCIAGHEASAVVESVGEGVTSVTVGDFVIPCYTPQCKDSGCKFCESDQTNLCPKIRAYQGKGVMPDGTSRFSKDGKPIFHFMGCSTFSEYTVLAEISCAKVSPLADSKLTCLLGCGIATGWGAVDNNANVTPGSTVAVFGLGALGLSVIQRAKQRGAKRIVGIDINDGKFEIAKSLGATECVLSDSDIQANLLKMEQWGFDFTFDCTGNVNVMRTALESSHRGWGVSCVIGVAPAGKEISTRPFQLVTGRRWIGTAFGGWKSRDEVPQLVQSVMRTETTLEPYVTHQFDGVNATSKAIETLHSGTCIRAVVHYVTDEERTKLIKETTDEGMKHSSKALVLKDRQKVHEGVLARYEHDAVSVQGRKMTFSIFLPPSGSRSAPAPPVLLFLGGLTCTDENARTKANIYQFAAKYGYAVVFPDTSPRGCELEGEADDWAVGVGASYYLDSTKAPYKDIYNMESYLVHDLPATLKEYFSVDTTRMGITGFSMGGHGAISLHLKHPTVFKSCSAFSPIASITKGPFGDACRSKLLLNEEEAVEHDCVSLLRTKPSKAHILVDQGSEDQFLDTHLNFDELKNVRNESSQKLTLNFRPGYGHDFHFVSSFVEQHVAHHAACVQQSMQF